MTQFYQPLTPVDLSQLPESGVQFDALPQGLSGVDIGIRPCRQNGPFIQAREKNDKLVIHNYGHGGAGWSLSHGSVLHSLELLAQHKPDKHHPITIIGAGVMGLLSAIYLHDQGYSNITICASQFENITSCRSTGYYAPLAMGLDNDEQQRFINEIGFKTFSTFQTIEQGLHPVFKQGIQPIDVYTGVGEGTGAIETQSGLEPYVQNGILPEAELGEIDFGNGQSHHMRRFHTYFMNTPVIMKELGLLVEMKGIRRVQKTVHNFSEVRSDIIFNCSGISARELNHDEDVHPNLGLLLLLRQPRIKELNYIIYSRFRTTPDSEPDYIYFMPRGDGLLGATFIPFNDGTDTKQNQQLVQRIIRNNKAFFGT